MVAPTVREYTRIFTGQLAELDIPYIYIDSNIKDIPPLAFFGQNSRQSGYFAARMLMLLAGNEKEIVIFRKIHEPAGEQRKRIQTIYERTSPCMQYIRTGSSCRT